MRARMNGSCPGPRRSIRPPGVSAPGGLFPWTAALSRATKRPGNETVLISDPQHISDHFGRSRGLGRVCAKIPLTGMRRLRRDLFAVTLITLLVHAGVVTFGSLRGCWGTEHRHSGVDARDCSMHHQVGPEASPEPHHVPDAHHA